MTTAATYQVKASTYGPSGEGNSLYVQVDSGSIVVWHLPVDSTSYRQSTTLGSYYLTPGEHTVTIYLREDGARLDWLKLGRFPGP
ncbi:MAG: hypothetical protein GY753_02880 [Gammaproteobacteria bacterium]|nr:hypothetical protein [Gammaproteobacteria bacterium]